MQVLKCHLLLAVALGLANAVSAQPTEIIVSGDDGTREILLSQRFAVCIADDQPNGSERHERRLAAIVTQYSKRPLAESPQIEFEVKSSDLKLVARALHERDGRPRRIDIIDTNRGVKLSTITTQHDLMDATWELKSGSLLTIQRRFVRNSFAPLSLLAAIAGHPVSLYEFRVVQFSPPAWKVGGDVVVTTGAYSLAVFSSISIGAHLECR